MNLHLLIVVWLAIQIAFLVWMDKGRPPVPVRHKYPFSTRLRVAIPGAGWRRRFAAEDVPAFQRFRVRLFVQWGVMMGTFTLLYLYMVLTALAA
jgi:hypothetical protein